MYDGRAIVGPSIQDERAGTSLSENISKLKNAQAEGNTSRNVYWSWVDSLESMLIAPLMRLTGTSGTGIGLVNEAASAKDIVIKTRKEALESLKVV